LVKHKELRQEVPDAPHQTLTKQKFRVQKVKLISYVPGVEEVKDIIWSPGQ